jgi:hypothetical protein
MIGWVNGDQTHLANAAKKQTLILYIIPQIMTDLRASMEEENT